MTSLRAFAVRFLPGKPNFATIAIGELTDTQMRRTGLSKAELLHRTFSGLSTCG